MAPTKRIRGRRVVGRKRPPHGNRVTGDEQAKQTQTQPNQPYQTEILHNLKSWAPKNKDDYARALGTHIIEECTKANWKTKTNSEKVYTLEKIFIQVAIQHEKLKTLDSPAELVPDTELQRAIYGRKWFRERKMHKEAANIAKQAQQLAKKLSRDRIKMKVDQVVEKFQGLKWVQQIKKGGRKNKPYCMKHQNGKKDTTQKGMANVFGKFYEDLYASRNPDDFNSIFKAKNKNKLPKVSIEEVSTALKEMKHWKCRDTKHVTAEVIKHVGHKTNKIISHVCADIINGGDIPESWSKNTITVLHKTGPTCDASNYRPICILDITYNILSRIIYNRIMRKINAAQSVDQAGFLQGFRAMRTWWPAPCW